MVLRVAGDRTPGFKLTLALLVGFVLTIPLLSVYFLASDRESQSREAARSITAGWGGPQTMSGPLLVIPYKATTTETVLQNGQSVTKTNEVARELTIAPEIVEMTTGMNHQVKKRSIYEAVLAPILRCPPAGIRSGFSRVAEAVARLAASSLGSTRGHCRRNRSSLISITSSAAMRR
jgi:hypothetical protein